MEYTIGKRLKAARMALPRKARTLQAVAVALNERGWTKVSNAHVSYWERKGPPRDPVLFDALCEVLRIQRDNLVRGKRERRGHQIPTDVPSQT